MDEEEREDDETDAVLLRAHLYSQWCALRTCKLSIWTIFYILNCKKMTKSDKFSSVEMCTIHYKILSDFVILVCLRIRSSLYWDFTSS
jgi:hypothetical protein